MFRMKFCVRKVNTCQIVNMECFLFHPVLEKYNFNQYRTYPKYSDRKAWANSVDPDQTPHNVASDLGLHSLQPLHQF